MQLEILEETRNKMSRYELAPTNLTKLEHLLEGVPVGGRYNVCVHVAVKDAEVRCVSFRSKELEEPSNVVAWVAPNGHVMVSWLDVLAHTNTGLKYEVLVSRKEIADDILRPSDDMTSTISEFSPLLIELPSYEKGPLYVGVRVVTPEGYYSDLSEVQTLEMQGSEPEPVSAVSALWWGAGAAIICAVALAGGLLHMALRHRRLTRSFLRFTAHTPRYDNRRGQATIGDHDDDDVPPIHGFSDDEPLVIA